jgi:hypothetical protein
VRHGFVSGVWGPLVRKAVLHLKGRDHDGGPSFPIPVWNGIFDHRQKIGSAVWVFLWCIDRITLEEAGVGFVLNGAAVTAGRIARELHDSERTVRRHLKILSKQGYIALNRNPYGVAISVANSCKFGIWGSGKNGPPVRKKIAIRSDKIAVTPDKSVQCNKEDSAVDSTERQNLPLLPHSGDLTPRQLKDLSKEMNRIAGALVGGGVTDDDVLRAACFRLLIPLDAARMALKLSLGDHPP